MSIVPIIFCVLISHCVDVFSVNPMTATPLSSYEVVMGWRKLEFNFSSASIDEQRILKADYVPENNIFTGIQVTEDRIFLAISRRRDGVVATLAFVPYDSSSMTPNSPAQPKSGSGNLLSPYPSWALQKVGDCKALQNVQTIQKDVFKRLWVIDTGIHSNSTGVVKCPPKLVLIDLETDNIVFSYDFPQQVVDRNRNLLSNLVVGCQNLTDRDDCWAYISDSAAATLVIFHLRNKQSWRVRHPTMMGNSSANVITILGHKYSFESSINGLALSPFDHGFDKIYFCALSSYNLYAVPTQILKLAGANGYSSDLLNADVTFVGAKFSQSDGLEMTANGLLLYGDLSSNAISFWNTSHQTVDPADEVLLVQNDIDLQWIDSFSCDENGYIYVTTNRMQRALANSYDFQDVNFRILRIYVGSRCYQYPSVDDDWEKSHGTSSGRKPIHFISYSAWYLVAAVVIVLILK